MIKKAVALVLIGVMTISLSACGRTVSEEVVVEAFKEALSEESEIEASFDAMEEMHNQPENDVPVLEDGGEYFNFSLYNIEDWQKAYMGVIADYLMKRESDSDNVMTLGMEDAEGFFLADMSGDGIPELIIRSGNCEAAYMDDVYSYMNGQAYSCGSMGGGHTSYWSTTDGSAVIRQNAHMGYQTIDRLKLVGAEIESEQLLQEDISGSAEADYRSPAEIVPGAEYITEKNIMLSLPLVEYNNVISTKDANLSGLEVEAKLDSIVNDGGEVVPVFAEHFRARMNPLNYNELIKAGNMYEWADSDAVLVEKIMEDINGDGQSELILNYGDSGIMVLSCQNSKVYAYIINYTYGTQGLTVQDGYIVSPGDYPSPMKLHFSKEQAYIEYKY